MSGQWRSSSLVSPVAGALQVRQAGREHGAGGSTGARWNQEQNRKWSPQLGYFHCKVQRVSGTRSTLGVRCGLSCATIILTFYFFYTQRLENTYIPIVNKKIY